MTRLQLVLLALTVCVALLVGYSAGVSASQSSTGQTSSGSCRCVRPAPAARLGEEWSCKLPGKAFEEP